jgi:predicted dithiol-disulfide oxidoreductase (DUF899 family)
MRKGTVGTGEARLAAPTQLLEREKELTRHSNGLARQGRELIELALRLVFGTTWRTG